MGSWLLISGCFSIGLMVFSLMASPWNTSKKIALVMSLVLLLCLVLALETYDVIVNQALTLFQGEYLLVLFIGLSLLYHVILIIVIVSHQVSLNRKINVLTKHYKEKKLWGKMY